MNELLCPVESKFDGTGLIQRISPGKSKLWSVIGLNYFPVSISDGIYFRVNILRRSFAIDERSSRSIAFENCIPEAPVECKVIADGIFIGDIKC